MRFHLATALPLAVALAVAITCHERAQADTLISDFNTFFENVLYASWAAPSAIIVSGPESYSVSATGYGSNYTYIGDLGIVGAGNKYLKLDVTLSGPPAANGQLGPIITLGDADGSSHNFAWFGQLLGHHLLTIPITSPAWISAAGTTPGLDLNNLHHMHMQMDPGQFNNTTYTVEWQNLSLIVPEPSSILLLSLGTLGILTRRRDR